MFIKYYDPRYPDVPRLLNTVHCNEFFIEKYSSKRTGVDRYELRVKVNLFQQKPSRVTLCVEEDRSVLLELFDQFAIAIQNGDKIFEFPLLSQGEE